jgi:hypothetical protein
LTGSARIAVSSRRRPAAIDRAPRSLRRSERLASSGVVQTLADDIARALSDPGVRASLVKQGAQPMSMTQPDFTRFVLRESESAARIIEAAGIKPQ